MKNTLSIMALLLSSCSLYADELAIPEKVIASWGYKTISFDGQQKIKSLTKAPAKTMTIYPRFYLSKKCLCNTEDAKLHARSIRTDINSTKVGRIKNYTEILVERNCVYTINTDSKYLAIKFQPEIVSLVRSYIKLN